MTRLLLAIILFLGVESFRVVMNTQDRVSAQKYARGTAMMQNKFLLKDFKSRRD